MTLRHSLLSTMMSSKFEDPVEILTACHRRVSHMLGLLERLVEHLDQVGSDNSARQAARDLTRFFNLAAVHHYNDEELHVVPPLRRLGHDALAQRILDEHRKLWLDWAQIEEGLRELSMRSSGHRVWPPARRSAWKRFASDYRAHLAFEEREVFPRVEAAVGRAESMDLCEQMSRRHGAHP